MGGSERDPVERGRHHKQFQDFHQDSFPGLEDSNNMVEIYEEIFSGAGRVHGACQAGGANARCYPANVLGGTASKG